MKSLYRIILIISIIGGSTYKVFSQTDSVTICFSQENADSSFDFGQHLRYRYMEINLNLKDESWLFKIGLPSFGITSNKSKDGYDYQNLGLSLAVEKKITTPLSIIIQNSNSYNKSGDSVFVYSGMDYGIRYYFLMKNRIRKGVSGDNCNGVYFDFFVLGLNKYDYQQYNLAFQNFFNSDVKYHNYTYLWNKTPSYSISIGLQKKLNNFSYFDIKLFAQYQPEYSYKRYVLKEYIDYDFRPEIEEYTADSYYKFGIDFKIGLAWGLK